MSSEPETWLGNVMWAAGDRDGPVRDCQCDELFVPPLAPEFTSTYGGSEPGVPTIAIPRTACLGCGLPLPHAAGECKRGDR